MLVIPAIELRDGFCVHAEPGDDEVHFESPLAVVDAMVQVGISRLHVVDVNASQNGSPENAHVIEVLAKRFPALQIQVAGGIRREELIPIYLDSGARFVVLSAKLARDPGLIGEWTSDYPEQLLAAVDARDGLCYGGEALETARALADEGVAGIVYTNIPSDGQVNGAQWESALKLAEGLPIPVIGNGLLRSSADMDVVRERAGNRLQGVLIGRSGFLRLGLAGR